MGMDFIMMRDLCNPIAVEIYLDAIVIWLLFGDGETIDLCMN